MSGALQAVFQNLRSFGGTFANWIALLGGTGANNAYGRSVAIDSSGNVYAGGYTPVGGGGSDSFELAKYNSIGTIQWQNKLGISGNSNIEQAWGVSTDSSSNVYICGNAEDVNGYSDLIVAKYDTSGTLQWQRKLTTGSAHYLYAWGIYVDSSANVYASGQANASGNGGALLAKYNSSGTLQWQKLLNTAGDNEVFNSVTVDSSGNVFGLGYANISGSAFSSMILAKYNSSGVLQFQKRLYGSYDVVGYKTAIDSSNNVYVFGYSVPTAANLYFTLAKYNNSGTLQWQKNLGNSNNSVGISMAIDSSDYVYVTGYISESGDSTESIGIAKYNSSGTIQWQRKLSVTGTTAYQYGHGITTDTSGNIYIVGQSAITGPANFLIAKLPADGSLTGTYPIDSYSMTYSASTLTDSTPTYTSATTTLTDSTPTNTSSASSLTSSASTLTSIVGSL
jgi:uncharacterized delta-60 repeat protein